jgi:hypothetical protein
MKLLAFVAMTLCTTVFQTPRFPVSGSIGIYAIVDKVVFEPNSGPTQRVKIWGVFMRATSRSEYTSPERGYLYLEIVPEREKWIRKEWEELRSIAGSNEAVGFASRWEPNPLDPNGNPRVPVFVTVYKDSEEGSPEPHPFGVGGIMKLGTQTNGSPILSQLRAAHRRQ